MEENKKFKLVSSKKTRYLLPNILTLGGVCLGISSIKFSIDGNYSLAVISICEPTEICELKEGSLRRYQIDPRELGHHHASLDGLSVSTSAESAALIKSALGGEQSESAVKARSIIALNAGAGLYVGGQASSLSAGVQLAEDTITSGAALGVIQAFAEKTQIAAEA